MGLITDILDAIRRIGSPTQRSALKRQDAQLDGKIVTDRRREMARSSLGTTEQFVATTEPVPETIRPFNEEEARWKRIRDREQGFFRPIYISLEEAAGKDWAANDAP